MKLLTVKPSTRKTKKLMATFEMNDGNKEVIHFGAKGMNDYLIYYQENPKLAKERREAYRKRFKSATTAPLNTANALSYYLLWGDSSSLQRNISSFRKMLKEKHLSL